MSKRKIMIVVVASLTLIALLVIAVPVLAADSSTPTNPANKAKVLIRLLLVQDEAKVNAFLDKAVDAGKLTPEQAVKVKDFWTAHHKQFARSFILKRLLRAQDEAKVKAFLDTAVASGKIQQVQADKIIQVWEVLHAPTPATSAQWSVRIN